MYGDRESSCKDDDFNNDDEYCQNCDQFEACIARELKKYITFND